MPGMRAMAAMSVQDDVAVQRAVSVLGGVAEDERAPVRDRADALTAAVEIAQRCGGALDSPVLGIVSRATADRRSELLHACCHVIIRFAAQLRDSLLPSLLGAVRCLDISATPTRSAADMPLYSLLRTGRRKEALSCLETLLRNSRADNPFRRPWIDRAPLGHDDRGPLADGDLPMAPDGREDIVRGRPPSTDLGQQPKARVRFRPRQPGLA